MRKHNQAIQIDDNITDIFNLPCVESVYKIKCDYTLHTETGELILDKEELKPIFSLRSGEIAETGDWLLQDVCGNWHVMTDEEYQKHKDDEIGQE